MHRGGRKQTIDDRRRGPFCRRTGRDSSPTVRDRCVYSQDAARETKHQIAIEPRLKRNTASSVREQGNPFSDFAERQHTQVQERLVGAFDPFNDALIGPGSCYFGNNIRVEQESAHSSISRPLSGSLFRSRFTPLRGEVRKNSTRLLGWRLLATSSSNCSAGTITTASFPALVTYCGPSERASRKTSLKRAFAVCNCQPALVVLRGFID
jgi:hypothetical protein